MNYHIKITTLDGQGQRLFDQTPNVHRVEVDLISPEPMDYFEHRFNQVL